MSTGDTLQYLWREYRVICQQMYLPCAPDIVNADEHVRREIMLLASIVETQLRSIADREKGHAK